MISTSASVPPGERLGYMPQLDALRAFAVSIVIVSHWFDSVPTIKALPLGPIGVLTFFVLSGFLITRILMSYRDSIEAGSGTTKHYLGVFFYRRFLRIFPIYYLTILAIVLLTLPVQKSTLGWHSLYLSNVYMALVRNDWQGSISHFWSLSVEEQFYLFWPFVVLLVRPKYLLPVIIATIATGVLWRYVNPTGSKLNHILTPGCFDSLGLGALLAYYNEPVQRFISKNRGLYGLLLLAVTAVVGVVLRFYSTVVTEKFAISLVAVLLIAKTVGGFSGVGKATLENRALIYLGKISYGLYLYHNFIHIPAKIKLPGGSVEVPQMLNLPLRLAFLLLIASLSYYAIEKPLMKLKNVNILTKLPKLRFWRPMNS